MKAFVVKEFYYDNCNVWHSEDSYWFSKEKAILRVKEVEQQRKNESRSVLNYWTEMEEIEING